MIFSALNLGQSAGFGGDSEYRNGAARESRPQNLEIPGSMLSHRPGMTG
jgi:hypothetical protein